MTKPSTIASNQAQGVKFAGIAKQPMLLNAIMLTSDAPPANSAISIPYLVVVVCPGVPIVMDDCTKDRGQQGALGGNRPIAAKAVVGVQHGRKPRHDMSCVGTIVVRHILVPGGLAEGGLQQP